MSITSLERYLAPFLNPDGADMSVLLGAVASALDDVETFRQSQFQILSVLGATGSALDTVAANFGLKRLVGETDSALLTRIAALGGPRATPNSFAYNLGIVSSLVPANATFVEPSGGVTIGWNPSTNFSLDRTKLNPVYARASGATGPDGSNEPNNAPTWLEQANGTAWIGVFQAATQLLTNTAFALSSGGIPSGYSESLISGDTMTLASGSTYPISGDSYVEWARTAASTGTVSSMFTSPAVTVAPSTAYALSLYIDTAGLSAGSVSLVAIDAAASTRTTIATTGTVNGYFQLSGTYATGSTATTLQLQIEFLPALYGTVSFGSLQIEAALGATEYLRNDSTTASAVRDVETFTYPASTIPSTGQGIVAVAFSVTESSQSQVSYLLDSPGIVLWWTGSEWNFSISNSGGTTVLSSVGSLSVGTHYLVARWSNILGMADFWIDGVVSDSIPMGSVIYGPNTVGTSLLHVGSNSSGAQQANGYLGNISILSAWLPRMSPAAFPSGQLSLNWVASALTPIFSQTLLQANYNNRSTLSYSGGYELGAAYYLFVITQNISPILGEDPFWLDISGMDSGYALQGSGSGSTAPFYSESGNLLLANNIAAGVSPEPEQIGQLQ